jgi:hypothetical protein
LFRQEARIARCLDLANAGNRIAARIAMTAMTTSNSIKVKAFFVDIACVYNVAENLYNAITSNDDVTRMFIRLI